MADGVIVTKEGRRIQLDAGSTDMFVIPTGTTGVTNYYIIGYKLTTQSDDSQIAETFVQLMSSSSETITEDTFRAGATDVYVSLYRVQQNGVNLGTITGLLPELTNISELKSDLTKTSITILKNNNSHLRNDVVVEKYGNVVNIALRGFQSITPNTVTTLFNLPEPYRPAVPKQYEFITVVDDERYTIQVTVAGNVEFYDYSSTSYHVDSINMTLSYII